MIYYNNQKYGAKGVNLDQRIKYFTNEPLTFTVKGYIRLLNNRKVVFRTLYIEVPIMLRFNKR